eukprot:768537-Hanusia_phi.AAC.6
MRDEDKLIELRVAITESGENESDAVDDKPTSDHGAGGEVRSFIQMIDEVYADKRIKWKTDLTGVTVLQPFPTPRISSPAPLSSLPLSLF